MAQSHSADDLAAAAAAMWHIHASGGTVPNGPSSSASPSTTAGACGHEAELASVYSVLVSLPIPPRDDDNGTASAAADGEPPAVDGVAWIGQWVDSNAELHKHFDRKFDGALRVEALALHVERAQQKHQIAQAQALLDARVSEPTSNTDGTMISNHSHTSGAGDATIVGSRAWLNDREERLDSVLVHRTNEILSRQLDVMTQRCHRLAGECAVQRGLRTAGERHAAATLEEQHGLHKQLRDALEKSSVAHTRRERELMDERDMLTTNLRLMIEQLANENAHLKKQMGLDVTARVIDMTNAIGIAERPGGGDASNRSRREPSNNDTHVTISNDRPSVVSSSSRDTKTSDMPTTATVRPLAADRTETTTTRAAPRERSYTASVERALASGPATRPLPPVTVTPAIPGAAETDWRTTAPPLPASSPASRPAVPSSSSSAASAPYLNGTSSSTQPSSSSSSSYSSSIIAPRAVAPVSRQLVSLIDSASSSPTASSAATRAATAPSSAPMAIPPSGTGTGTGSTASTGTHTRQMSTSNGATFMMSGSPPDGYSYVPATTATDTGSGHTYDNHTNGNGNGNGNSNGSSMSSTDLPLDDDDLDDMAPSSSSASSTAPSSTATAPSSRSMASRIPGASFAKALVRAPMAAIVAHAKKPRDGPPRGLVSRLFQLE